LSAGCGFQRQDHARTLMDLRSAARDVPLTRSYS
jgi:hypothetical protein